VIDEFFIVLAYSRRTQIALWLGTLFFVTTLITGTFLVGDLEFHGVLAPLTEPVRAALGQRFERLAWGTLGGFVMLAVRFYFKDRKRLLGLSELK
jgi:hypothetical protein